MVVSLDSRLESNKEEEKKGGIPHEDAVEPRPQSGIPLEPLIILLVDVTV